MKIQTSWIARAQKNQYGEKDIDQKERIRIICRKYFGINLLIQNNNDFPIFINKRTGVREDPEHLTKEKILMMYHVFYPDLYTKYRYPEEIFVEIDGSVHWQNSKAVRRTNLRNQELGRIGHLVWLTDTEARTKIQRDLIWNLAELLHMKPKPK